MLSTLHSRAKKMLVITFTSLEQVDRLLTFGRAATWYAARAGTADEKTGTDRKQRYLVLFCFTPNHNFQLVN